MALGVLCVCTGNICRSPTAELLLGLLLPPSAGVSVESAGLNALVGFPVDADCAEVLRRLGASPDHHQARQFEAWMAEKADLVLTAERAQRDEVMILAPTAHRRTFTIKEFVRLGRYARPGSPAATIAHLSDIRGIDGAVGDQVDSILDPYRKGPARANEMVREMAINVHAVAEILLAAGTVRSQGLVRPSPRRAPPARPATLTGRRPLPYPR